MDMLDRMDKYYNSLSKPGQAYFYRLLSMSYNASAAKNVQYVMRRRQHAENQGTLDELPQHLSLRYTAMNNNISQFLHDSKKLDDKTRKQINTYFESDRYVQDFSRENLYKGMNQRHQWITANEMADEPMPNQQNQMQAPEEDLNAVFHGQQEQPVQNQQAQNTQQSQQSQQSQNNQAIDPIQAQIQQQFANVADNAPQQSQGSQESQEPNNQNQQQTQPTPEEEQEAEQMFAQQPTPQQTQSNQQRQGQQQLSQKGDTYSKDDINMIKEGLGLYQSLDSSGQRYFDANLNKARRAPKELDKIKNAKPDQLKKSEVSYDDYLKNIAYGEMLGRDGNYHQVNRPVPTKDRKSIDNYFAKSVGMPTDNFGMVLNGIKEYQDKQRQKKLHKSYIPRLSELQSAGKTATQGMQLYGTLSPEGRQYFKTNFYEAKKAPNRFQQMKIAPLADLTVDQRQAREKLDVTAKGEYFNHHGELVKGDNPVPNNELQKIDTYFKSPSTANSIAHGAVGSALLDYESKHVYQLAHPDRATQKVNHIYAKQGVDLYNNVSPEAQTYFLTALHQAKDSPDRFLRARHLPNDELTNRQRENRDKLKYAASGIYFSKRQGRYIGSGQAVPTDEKKQIDDYFDKKPTMTAIKYDTLPIELRKSQRQQAQKLFDKQQHPVKFLKNDYKATDPTRYNKMLETGANFFDSLSPKGRKYLLQSARLATFNLDDYNKALKGDPTKLTAQQHRIRHSLEQAAGRMEAPDGKPVRTSPYALDDKEKSDIDRFLQDNVTQAGLAHGDTYDAIVLRNMQNRDLKETRADERAHDPWVYYRHHLAVRERRAHPLIYAMAYQAGYASGQRSALRKIHAQQKYGSRPSAQSPLQRARQQTNIDRKGNATKERKKRFSASTPKQKAIQKSFKNILAKANKTYRPSPSQHHQTQGPSMS